MLLLLPAVDLRLTNRVDNRLAFGLTSLEAIAMFESNGIPDEKEDEGNGSLLVGNDESSGEVELEANDEDEDGIVDEDNGAEEEEDEDEAEENVNILVKKGGLELI